MSEMPIYEYIAVEGGCANCKEGFEFFQRPGEEPLEECFTCKSEVKRLISSGATVTPVSQVLSEENTAKKGVTTYRRVARGQYEKVAGSDDAPEQLEDDS